MMLRGFPFLFSFLFFFFIPIHFSLQKSFVSMMGTLGGSAIASAFYGEEKKISPIVERVIGKIIFCSSKIIYFFSFFQNIGLKHIKIDALRDITFERRDALLKSNPYPIGMVPTVSVVGSLKKCQFDGMYPGHRLIELVHKTER